MMIAMNERISIDPKVCHGKPVVKGTRTPVTVILNHLSVGDAAERIAREYGITLDDIRACIAFASEELSHLTFQPTA
ncbi:hypothetical protein PLCT2_00414 [Planctomycetaceae bacterium]|nr:hypothetical protein PLCT2_00414 [Planctomycetaceae bacterium]